jgi:hypothetical protein
MLLLSPADSSSDDQTNRRRGKHREKQGKCPIICQNSDKKWPTLAHTTKKPNIETTSRAVTDDQSGTARLFCHTSALPRRHRLPGLFSFRQEALKMPETLNLNYYYGNEADLYKFYSISKILLTDHRYKNISLESKVLHGLLLTSIAKRFKSMMPCSNKLPRCKHSNTTGVFASCFAGAGYSPQPRYARC